MTSSATNAKDVFRSGLPFRLKPLAAFLALYGDRDGLNIYPSVGRLAHELGKSERQIQRQLTDLINLCVLIAETDRTGGRGQTTIYRLNLEALPGRAAYEIPYGKPRHGRQGLEDVKGDTGVMVFEEKGDMGVRVSEEKGDMGDAKPRHGRQKRVTPVTEKGDMGVTRSKRDQVVDQVVDLVAERDAAADASGTSTNQLPPTAKKPLTNEELDNVLGTFQHDHESRQEAIRRLQLKVAPGRVLSTAAG